MEKFYYSEEMIPVDNIVCSEDLKMHCDKRKKEVKGGDNDDADSILNDSLNVRGMLDPIKVRRMTKNTYLLLDGRKRLDAHKRKSPSEPIRCVVKESDAVRSGKIEDTVTAEDWCDAATYNLAREHVSHRVVEKIVANLHKNGLGYAHIAKEIGYSKAGVQKIVNRIKNCNTDDKEATPSQVSIREIKRTRTLLKNVEKIFKDMREEVSSAFKKVDAFLEEQEKNSQQATAPNDSVDRVDNNDTAQDVDTANQAEAT